MKPKWPHIFWLITIAAVQGSWLFAVRHGFALKWNKPALPFLGFYGFYLLSFGVTTWFQSRKTRFLYRCGLGWLLWLVMAVIFTKLERYGQMDWLDPVWCTSLLQGLAQMTPLITPEKILYFFSAVFWVLGQRLAAVRMDFNVALSEFQFGFAVLLIVFFIYSRIHIAVTALMPVPIIFFTSALLSMSFAFANTGKGWMAGQFRRQWLGIVMLSLLVILMLGFLFAVSVNPDIIKWTYTILKNTGMFIWEFILTVIRFIAGLFPDPEPYELPGRQMPAIDTQGARTTLFQLPESVRRIGGYVYMGFWLILILLALRTITSQIFNWLQRVISGTPAVEIETLPGAFRQDLLNLLKKIGAWLAWFCHQIKKRIRHIFDLDSADGKLLNVRQIYRQLLKLAHKSGIVRSEFQTPFEYQIDLVKWLPQARRELEYITNQYVASRYSRHIPCERTDSQIKQCWLHIKDRHLKNSNNRGEKSAWFRQKRN